MPANSWARTQDKFAATLRRGAWYPVVEEDPAGQVVVQVGQERVTLKREMALVRTEPPTHWSVVVRTGVMRPTWGGQHNVSDNTYAVCPHCAERQFFDGQPRAIECRRCHKNSPVDWSTTC